MHPRRCLLVNKCFSALTFKCQSTLRMIIIKHCQWDAQSPSSSTLGLAHWTQCAADVPSTVGCHVAAPRTMELLQSITPGNCCCFKHKWQHRTFATSHRKERQGCNRCTCKCKTSIPELFSRLLYFSSKKASISSPILSKFLCGDAAVPTLCCILGGILAARGLFGLRGHLP